MTLSDKVRVVRRFQRSIRIDLDLNDPEALVGFVCPRSSAVVLETISRHVKDGKQSAFTWTGPFGSGKSSLVIALGAALNGKVEIRNKAAKILGKQTIEKIWEAMPPRSKGWRRLAVIGTRDRPAQVIGSAMVRAKLIRSQRQSDWSDEVVLKALQRVANRTPRVNGGLIVFIDEMGKFLESAIFEGTDIYFFQQLAELASRSNGRLVVVGILHQAFDEYAYRFSREMRDEWAKIQGRFIDISVSPSVDEQLELLGRAIDTNRSANGEFIHLSATITDLTRRSVKTNQLVACWPLHPVVACLLGPISRRRFGQNQRSIFGFLNSAEPHGFQDFLQTAKDCDLYTPDMLWDYLSFNVEPSIMASPDGHRWGMVKHALENCRSASSHKLYVRMLKTIGLLDLLKEQSGLVANQQLLRNIFREYDIEEISKTLSEMLVSSLIIYRRFNDSYCIFDGSDFDIEKAIDAADAKSIELDFARLTKLSGLPPVIAKRHYHDTGALRWFDMFVSLARDVTEVAEAYVPADGTAGAFILALPAPSDPPDSVERIIRQAVAKNTEVVVGVPLCDVWSITTLARELIALEQIRDGSTELQGDRVARTEVQARISELSGYIEEQLIRAMSDVRWYEHGKNATNRNQENLNSLASEIADKRYRDSPRINNELLNRIKPSSSAVAARNALLRRMTLFEGKERLGIDGYPAEGGLFDSLLGASGLYGKGEEGWHFVEPKVPSEDICNLEPAWKTATVYIKNNTNRNVPLTEIYDIWKAPPFGIKDGLLPVLGVAFILTNRPRVALYREEIFQPKLTDLDVDFLKNDASDIQIRWMELSDFSRELLAALTSVVRGFDPSNQLLIQEPIDIARGLVSIYDRLPTWVKRTHRVSANAKRVRQLFNRARDPNSFLFDDIPQLMQLKCNDEERVQQIAGVVQSGLNELCEAYPSMLRRLRETLLMELGVSNTSNSMLDELRARAENIRRISGNHKLEAFILRIIAFEGRDADMESLASMSVSKPPRLWVDSDVDLATVELAELARNFKKHEAFAHVQGRQDKRLAMAVVVGIDGQPIHDEIEVTSNEETQVDNLIMRVHDVLSESGAEQRNIILAALLKVTADILEGRNIKPETKIRKAR